MRSGVYTGWQWHKWRLSCGWRSASSGSPLHGLWTPQSAAITDPPVPQPAALGPSPRNKTHKSRLKCEIKYDLYRISAVLLFAMWSYCKRPMAPTTSSRGGKVEEIWRCTGVERCKIVFLGAFPIHLFRHFSCRMYCLATIHFVTDRRTRTDRQKYRDNSRSQCVQPYDRLKWKWTSNLQT